MTAGTMHALFLAVNTCFANDLNAIVMSTISQKIIDDISPHIRGFIN
jgi:hypothetical protein